MAALSSFEVDTVLDGVDGSAPVVVVTGEVDVATSPELGKEIRAVMAAGARRVVVDLGAVEFIDASGIGVLASAASAARGDGGALVLRRPSPIVRRVLDIVALDGSLPIEEGSGDP